MTIWECKRWSYRRLDNIWPGFTLFQWQLLDIKEKRFIKRNLLRKVGLALFLHFFIVIKLKTLPHTHFFILVLWICNCILSLLFYMGRVSFELVLLLMKSFLFIEVIIWALHFCIFQLIGRFFSSVSTKWRMSLILIF